MPVCPELVREHIPKTKDVGHFLSVTGTVIRTSLVKILEFEREYMCNKCKHVFVVKADFEQYYVFCRPSSCPSSENCGSSKFTCLSGSASSPVRCRDYQEIKIQEQVNDQINGKNNTIEEVFFSNGQIAWTREHCGLQMEFLSSFCGRSSVKLLNICQDIVCIGHEIIIFSCRALSRGLWNDLLMTLKLKSECLRSSNLLYLTKGQEKIK